MAEVPRPASVTFPAMGTDVTVRWGPATLDIAQRLISRAGQLEALLSRFIAGSEVATASQAWQSVSADTAAVLEASQRWDEATGGAFSAVLGARMRAWRDGARGTRPRDAPGVSAGGGTAVPGGIEVRRLSADGGPQRWSARVVNGERRCVDVGGIAKGYAADQLRDLAVSEGASDVLVSCGRSSIAVSGAAAMVAIASPWAGIDQFGVLRLESGSLSVSADQGVLVARGGAASHVLDPATGAPAVSDLCAVVVCGADGMACEAFSTACLVMGLDRAMELDKAHPELRTLFMTVDGRVIADPRLYVRAMPGVQARLAAWRG